MNVMLTRGASQEHGTSLVCRDCFAQGPIAPSDEAAAKAWASVQPEAMYGPKVDA